MRQEDPIGNLDSYPIIRRPGHRLQSQENKKLKNAGLFLKNLLILILLIWGIAGASAQDLVYPNRPAAIIKSNQGLIAVLEYHGGYGFGDTNERYSKSFSGINLLVGYQLNRNFIVAAGTGFSAYKEGSLMPIYGDLRYTFVIRQIAPYFYGDAGLLMNFYDMSSTRIFLNPGMGARYSLSKKFAVNLAAGIFIQTGTSGQDAFVNLRTGVTYKF